MGMDKPLPPSPRKGALEYDDLIEAVDSRRMSGADACAIEKQRRHEASLRLQQRERSASQKRLVPTANGYPATSPSKQQDAPRSPRRTSALRPKQSFSTSELQSARRSQRITPASAARPLLNDWSTTQLLDDPSRLLMTAYTNQYKARASHTRTCLSQRPCMPVRAHRVFDTRRCRYKQRMVGEMTQTLSTTRKPVAWEAGSASRMPIQDNDWCTGVLKKGIIGGVPLRATPVLSLYESERMLKAQEAGAQWEWPSRARTPSRPSSPVVERLSRLEPIITSHGSTPAGAGIRGGTPGRAGRSPRRDSRHPRGSPPPWSLSTSQATSRAPSRGETGMYMSRPASRGESGWINGSVPYPGLGRLILTDNAFGATAQPPPSGEGAPLGRPFHSTPGGVLMIRVA